MKELNTTYRLCGKTSRIFTLEKKKWGHSEVTGNAAGRRGPRRDVASALQPPLRAPRSPDSLRAGITENHVRAPATGTHRHKIPKPNRDAAILFSNLLYLPIFIIFSHFDILFFSWCAQLTCCAWPASICQPIMWSNVFDIFFYDFPVFEWYGAPNGTETFVVSLYITSSIVTLQKI